MQLRNGQALCACSEQGQAIVHRRRKEKSSSDIKERLVQRWNLCKRLVLFRLTDLLHLNVCHPGTLL